MIMGGVDKADKLAITYIVLCEIGVCVINSYILYKVSARRENKTSVTFYVCPEIGGTTCRWCSCSWSLKSGRPASLGKEERFNGTLHILRENVKSRDYSVSSNRKIKSRRRQTNYFCDTCNWKPGLYVGDCFNRYYTMKDYKHFLHFMQIC